MKDSIKNGFLEYRLIRCPKGYKLENSTHDNAQCKKCPLSYYVMDSNNPSDVCRKCPISATCIGGRPPIFRAVTVNAMLELEQDLRNSSDVATILEALAVLLQVDSAQITQSLPGVAAPVTAPARRLPRATGFAVILDSAAASVLQRNIEAGLVTAQLSALLRQSPYNLNVTSVVSFNSASAAAGADGEVWEAMPDGTYLLKACPAGYLLVNSTLEAQTCVECDAQTYSRDATDGCKADETEGAVVCAQRECTVCPVGVDCAKGSADPWRHFVPKALKIGERVHSIATLISDGAVLQTFFCDQDTARCAPADPSDAMHAAALHNKVENYSYVWEYVRTCTKKSEPCTASQLPSFILRKCPPGTVMSNLSSSGVFEASFQECSPCGAGRYVLDPMFGPCQKCPEDADCPDGALFLPKTPGSIWTKEASQEADGGFLNRISICPAGWALERKESNPQADMYVSSLRC